MSGLRPVFCRGDIAWLATLAAVANLVLIAAIITTIGAFLMRHRLLAGVAVCAAALALSACSTIAGGGSQIDPKVLDNLRHCDRTYIAGAGGLAPPNVSISVTCKAEPFVPGEAAPEPSAP